VHGEAGEGGVSSPLGGEVLAQLPREAVDVPFLEVLEARMDGTLGNLSWWLTTLPTSGKWN